MHFLCQCGKDQRALYLLDFVHGIRTVEAIKAICVDSGQGKGA